jgi:hypothetical protein
MYLLARPILYILGLLHAHVQSKTVTWSAEMPCESLPWTSVHNTSSCCKLRSVCHRQRGRTNKREKERARERERERERERGKNHDEEWWEVALSEDQ